MVVLEYAAVEVDYCLGCHGVWLDAGELDLLFGDRALTAGFLTGGDSAQARGEKPRRCPICRRKMAKATTTGPEPVTYDECTHGDGLWFDGGELAAVLEHGSPSPGGEQVVGWLREMFGGEENAD
jgi:hypothetical protein